MTKIFAIAAAALLLVNGALNYRHTHAVCDGTANYALCDLSLQAGGDEARARADGNLGARSN